MANKLASDLPFNLDAEKACLGSALLGPDNANEVLNTLKEDDFYFGKHQIIFRAMYNLYNNKSIQIDSVTLTDELINMKELENIGGVEYLKECSDAMVSKGALDFYIKSVQNQSVLRKMLITIRDIDNRYRTKEISDVNDFIIESDAKFREAIENRKISDFESVKDMADRMRKLVNDLTPDTAHTGITTGYPCLDELTHGFGSSTMTILGGRPGMGKTSFALNLAYNAATKGRTTVGIFSLEMPKEQLYKRLIASQSHVPLESLDNGFLNDKQRINLSTTINQLSEANIFIDDTSGSTLGDIIAKTRKLAASNPDLGLIIVDHIGIIGSSNKGKSSAESRQLEVQKLSIGLRNLARELKIAILVLCQLTRISEQRENKRPMPSDLRESGSIEQDADVIIFLYRDDYYNNTGGEKKQVSSNKPEDQKSKADKEREAAEKLPHDASYMEVIVAKNRNGKTGKKGLFFFKEYGLFQQPSNEWQDVVDQNYNID